jgi:hypothetical protein
MTALTETFPGLCWFLVVLCVSWLVTAYLHSVAQSLHVPLLHILFSLLEGHLSLDSGPTLIQDDLFLGSLT